MLNSYMYVVNHPMVCRRIIWSTNLHKHMIEQVMVCSTCMTKSKL